MNALYELSGQYEYLLNCLYDEAYDEETLLDTLEGIEGEIETKADGYAKMMQVLSGDAEKLKEEEERLRARRKCLESRREWLKSQLYQAMKRTGKMKFKTLLFSFGIQKNPPSVVVDFPDQVPEAYRIYPEPVIDKARIKAGLNAGQDLPFAHLEQGESLRIR